MYPPRGDSWRMTIAPEGRTTTSLAQRVAAEIRAEMGRQNLSINGFATQLGVTQPWLWRRLRGNQPLTIEELETLAKALRVPAEELFVRAVAMAQGRRSAVTRLDTSGYSRIRPADTRPPGRLELPAPRRTVRLAA